MKTKAQIITSLLLLFFLSTNINAQSRFGASVVAGTNITQMREDGSGGFKKIGLHGGLRAHVYLTEKMEISLGIQYDERGSKNSTAELNQTTPYLFKLSYDYITVPVLFSYKDLYNEEKEFYSVQFTTGFSYGRLFQSSQNEENFIAALNSECFDAYSENDVSWLIGATYYVTKHIGVSAFHARSINKLKSSNKVDVCPDFLPYQWTFRAEYKF